MADERLPNLALIPPIKSLTTPHSTSIVVARLLAWMVIAVLSLATTADPDLWGHLRFGLDAIESKSLPSVDQYSFTQDVTWINHEWLSEVLLATAYRLALVDGMLALKVALVASALWIVWSALTGLPPGRRVGSLMLIAWSLLPLTLTIRPQLWSVLLFVCLLLIVDAGKWRWIAPPLFALWANLHGGWIVGVGMLAIATADAIGAKSNPFPLRIFTASLVATLVTPYSLTLWRFMWATVGFDRADIQEWQPLWTAPIPVWGPWIIAASITGVAAVNGRISRIRVVGLVGLGIASVRVLRLVPFFTILTIFWTLTRRPVQHTTRPFANRFLEGVSVAAVLAATWQVLGPQARCLPSGEWQPDATAARALRGATGRIAVHFDWGEYVIWHWGRQLRVSIDGRRETLYSDAVDEEQRALKLGGSTGFDFIERERPDYLWYPLSFQALQRWLPDHGYRVDVTTDRSFIGTRADLPRLHIPTHQHFGCFPGAGRDTTPATP